MIYILIFHFMMNLKIYLWRANCIFIKKNNWYGAEYYFLYIEPSFNSLDQNTNHTNTYLLPTYLKTNTKKSLFWKWYGILLALAVSSMILFERPQEEAIGTPLWFTVDQNRKKYDLAFANFCFRSSVCGFFKALYSKNSICVDFRLFTYLYYTFFHFFSTLCSVVSVWLAFWRLYYLQKGIYVGEYWCFPNRLTTTTTTT